MSAVVEIRTYRSARQPAEDEDASCLIHVHSSRHPGVLPAEALSHR